MKRYRQRGFTLIELLIVVAIIGLIAAMLVPNFLDALQKAKQKRTVSDQKVVGTALMAWLTDEVGGAAAGFGAGVNFQMSSYEPITREKLAELLVPQYIQNIPTQDGWGTRFDFRLNTNAPTELQVMAIRSFGQDRTADAETYIGAAFAPTDYAQDIVWADGYFIRWPDGLAFNNTPP